MNEKLDIRKLFADWVEPDESLYYLACLLGLMDFDASPEKWRQVKGWVWVRNPVSEALTNILEQIKTEGMLERNEDIQYRWNADFEKHFYPNGNRGGTPFD